MQDFGGSWGTGTAVWLRHVHTIDHAMRINESDHHRLAHSFLRQALLLGLDAIHPTELVLMPTWSPECHDVVWSLVLCVSMGVSVACVHVVMCCLVSYTMLGLTSRQVCRQYLVRDVCI